MGKREVSKKTKLTVHRTVYLPTLTYSAELWTLGAKQDSRLQAAEMRYLQRVEQKTRRAKVRNQMIRKALNVKPLQSQIQLRWFGHVVRMPKSRYPCMVWEARYEGRRTIGTPRNKLQDNIQNALLEKGVDWRQAQSRAQDRWLFAKLLHLMLEEA
jgi:hypothetical protein